MKIYPSNMNHLRFTKPTNQEIQDQYYFPCSITVLNQALSTAEVFYYDGEGNEFPQGRFNIPSDYLFQKALLKTDTAPTTKGLYPLSETGIYTNLGGINAQSGKLNFASFDGTTWSKVEVAIPNTTLSTLLDPNSTTKAETGKSVSDYVLGDAKREILGIELVNVPNENYIDGTFTLAGLGGKDSPDIYFDTRNILKKGERLKSFKAKFAYDGSFNLVFLQGGTIVHSEAFNNIGTSINTFTPTTTEWESDVVLGIQNGATNGTNISGKNDGLSTSRKIPANTTTVNASGYSAAFEFLKEDLPNSLGGRIDSVYDYLGAELVSLPNANYVDATFGTGIGLKNVTDVYFDTRNILKKGDKITSFKARFYNTGNFNLVFLQNGVIVHSEAFNTANQNVNTFVPTTTSWESDVVLGIQHGAVDGANIYAKLDNASTSRKIPANTTTVNVSSYSSAFEFTKEDLSTSLEGKIDSVYDYVNILTQSDTTSLQNAVNKGKVNLTSQVYNIEAPILIPSGCTIDGVFGKSILKPSPSFSGDVLKIENAEDVKLSNFRIEGNLAPYVYSMNGIDSGAGIVANENEALAETYIGNQNGINIDHSERVVLENLQFHKLSGIGLIMDYVGQSYIHSMKGSRLFFYNCYKGIKTINEAEYYNLSDVIVSLCQIGVHFTSGNMLCQGFIVTRNRFGVLFTEGYNHAHGIFANAEVKHNMIAGILFKDVTYGQYMPGLYFSFGTFVSRDSQKIFVPTPMIGGNVAINFSGASSSNNKIQNYGWTSMPNIISSEGLLITTNP